MESLAPLFSKGYPPFPVNRRRCSICFFSSWNGMPLTQASMEPAIKKISVLFLLRGWEDVSIAHEGIETGFFLHFIFLQ